MKHRNKRLLYRKINKLYAPSSDGVLILFINFGINVQQFERT